MKRTDLDELIIETTEDNPLSLSRLWEIIAEATIEITELEPAFNHLVFVRILQQ